MAANICVDVTHTLLGPPLGQPDIHHAVSNFSPAMLVVHLCVAALVAVECVAVGGYWLGRPWARWLVLAGCVFYLTSLRNLRTDWAHSHFEAALDVYGGVLAVFLIWYLYKRNVRAWFARSLPESTPA
jgi:hypothetical protein